MTATTSRPRLPRTLADIQAHPWVEWIDDSRHLGDGLHVYLRPGYVWADSVSAVVEPTVREACQAFREVAWDPAAWGEACGASPAEVAALTGEPTPAPAEAVKAAPVAPAAGRRLNPLAELLLTRLQAADGQWVMVEAAPIVDTLKGLGWVQRSDVEGLIGPDRAPAVECRITAAGLAALGESAPAPSIADMALEASAAVNAEGEAATARALAGIGRIRAGLDAIEALDRVAPPTLPQLRADAAAGRPVSLAQLARSIAAHPRPVLPGEATPPPAPSHGEAAPVLPELIEWPCPVGNGAPARAEAVMEVPGGGVAVTVTGSPREAFRLPDTVSVCGAAAALEAGGWILSPALEALARRWDDITGRQDPDPEAVAIAEAAAPLARRFEVFHRTWWQAPGIPGVGESHHVAWAQTEARARYLCRRWNAAHTPGPLSDRAEFTAA